MGLGRRGSDGVGVAVTMTFYYVESWSQGGDREVHRWMPWLWLWLWLWLCLCGSCLAHVMQRAHLSRPGQDDNERHDDGCTPMDIDAAPPAH